MELLWKEPKERRSLLLGAAALLLFILSRLFVGARLLGALLAAASALASAVGLLPQLLDSLQRRILRSGPILPFLSAVLATAAGRISAAALLLLCWLLLSWLVPVLHQQQLGVLARRRNSDLGSAMGLDAVERRSLSSAEALLERCFLYLVLVLTILTGAISALRSGSLTQGLGRAAPILLLGSAASFFSAYPLSDLAAGLRAAEQGVCFHGDSLLRLTRTKLCCIRLEEVSLQNGLAFHAADSLELHRSLLQRLAQQRAAAPEQDMLATLQALLDAPERSELTELPGYGVAARFGGHVLLLGSAELMHEAGLPLLPFRDGGSLIHMGLDGQYVGCVDPLPLPSNGAADILMENGFLFTAGEADAAARRQPGAPILYLPAPQELMEPADLAVSQWAVNAAADITLLRGGKAGLAALMEQLGNVLASRKRLLTTAVLLKALALLLALLGFCPLWLGALLELGCLCFGELYALHALDFEGRYGV